MAGNGNAGRKGAKLPSALLEVLRELQKREGGREGEKKRERERANAILQFCGAWFSPQAFGVNIGRP